MAENSNTKNKHMDFEMRLAIQAGIREGKKLKEIAEDIDKDPTTISKEIKKHRYKKVVCQESSKPNHCAKQRTCKKRNVCGKTKNKCRIACRTCRSCNERCPDYEKFECKTLKRFPYVCNVCSVKTSCVEDHHFYSAKMAQSSYENKLIESRQGICLTPDELEELDELISPALKKGHSLEMIYMEHEDEIPVSIKTVYNYLDQGILEARNIDCRNRVKYRKHSKASKRNKQEESKLKKGHEYEDFKKYIEEHPDKIVWELDTVEGVKGGKLFMTLMMRKINYMFMFIIESKEQKNTVHVFDELERILGHEQFQEMFEVVLTDNGTEFANPKLFERGLNGEQRMKLFYCEAGRSDQKGSLENNHHFIRYIIPKGTSIDELDEDATLKIMNNINSVRRGKLNASKPIQQLKMMFGNLDLEELGIEEIPQDEIVLRPSLIR